MSKWNHSICDACWWKREGQLQPHRMKDPKQRTCCYCGAENSSGIGVKDDPAKTLCHEIGRAHV